MIERMKKLTLLAVASERKALLKDLMLLGCVELKEQAATDEATPALREMGQTGLATEKARHAAITNALKLLDKYAPSAAQRRRRGAKRRPSRRSAPGRSWTCRSASAARSARR